MADEDQQAQGQGQVQATAEGAAVAEAAPAGGISVPPWARSLGVSGVRQIVLIVAAAVVLAVAVVALLWIDVATYRVLFYGLTDKDAAGVVASLERQAIPFKIDPTTGDVHVPADRLHDARYKLAAEGLPKGTGIGFEFLEQEGRFGSSQFTDVARHRVALENELGRSISSIGVVQSARVHLAIPTKSAFVRNREPPSASVILQLLPGRALDDTQVTAVTHMVATSVPGMTSGRVSVINQLGQLLSKLPGASPLSPNLEQLDYARRVEERYVRRVEEILMPIVGAGRVRAQAVVDLDFSMVETTEERFNSDNPAIRSEQVYTDRDTTPPAEGVPGALTNEPPGAEAGDAGASVTTATPAAEVEEFESDRAGGANFVGGVRPSRWTRNFELDKVISHTQAPTGRVRRLSVAVVLDDREELQDNGDTERKSFSPEEVNRLTELVKDAVGFSANRGDTVKVVNSTFLATDGAMEAKWYQQAWLLTLGKLLLGTVVFVMLLLIVVKPLLKTLNESYARPRLAGAGIPGVPGLPGMPGTPALAGAGTGALSGDLQGAMEGPATGMFGGLQAPDGEHSLEALEGGDPSADYQAHVTVAQRLAAEDPRRSAQVLKRWLDSSE